VVSRLGQCARIAAGMTAALWSSLSSPAPVGAGEVSLAARMHRLHSHLGRLVTLVATEGGYLHRLRWVLGRWVLGRWVQGRWVQGR